MDNNDEKKSFWTTLPGILSGIAAVLTAIAVLYTAFSAGNTPTSAPPTPAPTPTSTSTPTTTPTPTPLLSVSPDPILFNTGIVNSGESVLQIFSISNTGDGTLIWSISDDQPWITVDPSNGTNSGTVAININTAGLSSGSHKGTITITSNGGNKNGIVSLNIPHIPSPTIPTPTPTTIIPPLIPNPKLIITGTESYAAGGKQWIRYKLAIENWAEFPSELFDPAPDLPPCGLNTKASRTWVNIQNATNDNYIYGFCALSSPQDLTSIWFAVEQGSSPPAGVYVVLEDRRENKRYISNIVYL